MKIVKFFVPLTITTMAPSGFRGHVKQGISLHPA